MQWCFKRNRAHKMVVYSGQMKRNRLQEGQPRQDVAHSHDLQLSHKKKKKKQGCKFKGAVICFNTQTYMLNSARTLLSRPYG